MDFKVILFFSGKKQNEEIPFGPLKQSLGYIDSLLSGDSVVPHQMVIKFKEIDYLLLTVINSQSTIIKKGK